MIWARPPIGETPRPMPPIAGPVPGAAPPFSSASATEESKNVAVGLAALLEMRQSPPRPVPARVPAPVPAMTPAVLPAPAAVPPVPVPSADFASYVAAAASQRFLANALLSGAVGTGPAPAAPAAASAAPTAAPASAVPNPLSGYGRQRLPPGAAVPDRRLSQLQHQQHMQMQQQMQQQRPAPAPAVPRPPAGRAAAEPTTIRTEEIEAALASKPQRGKKRENLTTGERKELTKTRNREHARITR